MVELLVKAGADIGTKGTYFSPNPIFAKATGNAKTLCQDRPALLALRYEGLYERTLAKNMAAFPETKASSKNEISKNFQEELSKAGKSEKASPLFNKLQTELSKTNNLLEFYSVLGAFYQTYKDETSYQIMGRLSQCVIESLLVLKTSMSRPAAEDELEIQFIITSNKIASPPTSSSSIADALAAQHMAASNTNTSPATSSSSSALKIFGQFKHSSGAALANPREVISDPPETLPNEVGPLPVGLNNSLNQ